MAWPKLRNRSGAAHDGARSHGAAPGSAQGGPAQGTALSPGGPAPGVPAAGGPAPGGPAAWPGTGEPAGPAGAAGPEAELAEPSAEADPADLSFLDWDPAGESARLDEPEDQPEDQPAAGRADPPRPEWKPVVTPVAEARPGIGQRRGNLAHLTRNPRMRIWELRLAIALVVLVAFWILANWKLGLTLAVVAVIADTVIRSRHSYIVGGKKVRLTGAQRRTRKQLAKLARAGYRAMHASAIPESEDQIDHLVVGPAGVFAIDSEAWDKRLAVRTRNARQLWHGPFSKKDRLEHAQWEAQRAAELLSGAVGKPVAVRPAMAVYGPKIPWDVATIREVDVFSGPRLGKYLRRQARQSGVRPLSDEEIELIYQAANTAFPHLSSGSPAR